MNSIKCDFCGEEMEYNNEIQFKDGSFGFSGTFKFRGIYMDICEYCDNKLEKYIDNSK